LLQKIYAKPNITDAEKWRREMVREITKKIAAIQNGKPQIVAENKLINRRIFYIHPGDLEYIRCLVLPNLIH
jgi:hypothetical protein